MVKSRLREQPVGDLGAEDHGPTARSPSEAGAAMDPDLAEFLAGDTCGTDLDPLFRERLRRYLWSLVQEHHGPARGSGVHERSRSSNRSIAEGRPPRSHQPER